jgi:hypothetical protein
MILAAVSLLNFSRVSNGQSPTPDCKCAADAALSEIGKITAGMRRRDLERMFSVDGGISAVDPQRFVYKKCGFIKVDVKFEFVDKGKRFPKADAADEILAVSKPYLEQPFYD